MDTFASAIKNQHSFNKNDRITNSSAGNCCFSILGQPEDLELQILSIFTMQLITTLNHRK
jgi:hypothetical protein